MFRKHNVFAAQETFRSVVKSIVLRSNIRKNNI